MQPCPLPNVLNVAFGCLQGFHADIHVAGDEVLAAAASHVHSILHQFNQQNLALTLWAFAKLAWCPPTDLLSDAASLAVASLHTSNSQNLSNTLWAFATLGFMPQAGLLEVTQDAAHVIAPLITNQAPPSLFIQHNCQCTSSDAAQLTMHSWLTGCTYASSVT